MKNFLLASFLTGALVATNNLVPSLAQEKEAVSASDVDAAAADDLANSTNVTVPKVAPSQLRQNFNNDRTEAWGDIELVGGGQRWEYVKGLFGGSLACTPQRIVVGEPRLGCENLSNAADVKDSIVVLFRGECSFADKVAFAQDSGAAGVVIGNTGEELIRMPAGWLKYPNDIAIKIPVVVVRQTTALALRKIIARDAEVHAQIVAKHWTVKGEFAVGPCADALDISSEVEVDADGNAITSDADKLVLGEEGGQLQILNANGLDGVTQTKFEYLNGRFGGPRPQTVRELVWADPQDACTPLNNADDVVDKFVLTKRGGCAFTEKGHNIDAASGAASIVINNAANIVQMAQGDVKDYYVTVPTVMISNSAGDQLATALEESGSEPLIVSFNRFNVQANMWDSLNKLKTPQKWPVAESERTELYEDMAAQHDPAKSEIGSTERLAYLDMLYAQATKFWGASI
jgi:hypothetical protein